MTVRLGLEVLFPVIVIVSHRFDHGDATAAAWLSGFVNRVSSDQALLPRESVPGLIAVEVR